MRLRTNAPLLCATAVAALAVGWLALGRTAHVERFASAEQVRPSPPASTPSPVATAPSPAAAAPARIAVRNPAQVPAARTFPRPPPSVPAPAPAPEAAPAPAAEAAREAGPEHPEHGVGAIRGQLRSASGVPLVGVPVVAMAADGGDAAEGVTASDGGFLLVALRPGRYSVFAGLGTAISGRVGARGTDVEAGTVTSVALVERPAGATVRVRAVDAAGRETPAQAVLVPAGAGAPSCLDAVLASEAILLPGSVRTVVEAVPPGRYNVVLFQGERGVRAEPVPVDVARQDLDVVVRVPAVATAL